MTLRLSSLIILLLAGIVACSDEPAQEPVAASPDIEEVARTYTFLELAMGEIDANHVDAYFGPPEIREQAVAAELSLADIRTKAADLDTRLTEIQASGNVDPIRIASLKSRLRALDGRIAINLREYADFDEETAILFGSVAPTYDAAHFDAVLEEIDALVPGDGALSERVDNFKAQFAIPTDRLDAVFAAAIDECRRRTFEHINLAADESFTLEYVNDKPWSGYNWYQGNSASLIQLNTDFPMHIDRAVDLGCHEGYPGHHTYKALLEQRLVNDKGWIEFTIDPLFSSQSLIAEGSANYGIDLAFPDEERIDFEVNTLFPLAGLDQDKADEFYALAELLSRLNYARNEAARDYLNGDIDRDQAIDWVEKYTLVSRERAEQSVRFVETYRGYVINYNHGKDLVAAYIESDGADAETRWQRFEELLSMPVQPKQLEH